PMGAVLSALCKNMRAGPRRRLSATAGAVLIVCSRRATVCPSKGANSERGGELYGIYQAHRIAHVVRIRGGCVEHPHNCHEDNDSAACCKHDLQRAFHHLRVFRRNISDTCSEFDSSSTQHGSAAANAETDSGCRSCSLIRRIVD